MATKRRNYHIGGTQAPLFVPESKWVRPAQLPDLRRFKEIALDRETRDDGLNYGLGPGWAFGAGFVTGVSAAWKEGEEYKSFYAPLAHPDTECFDKDQVKRWELDHQKAGVRFVMQNAPYDVGWGDQDLGVPCPELIDDTTCMAYLVDETMREFNLDALCAWRGLPGKDERLLREAAAVYGFDPKREMWKLPARYVAEYAAIDSVRTLQLKHSLEPEIEKQDLRAAYQLEMDLLPMVHAMRKRGIRVNLDAAERAKNYCIKTSEDAFKHLSEKMGTKVTIDEARSNSWLTRAFDEFRVRYPKDEYGKGSFEAKWMKNDPHWLPQLLVRGKSYHEAAHKFIQTYIIDFAHNGRLHASINQFKSETGGTKTYRFSYADPPLQQMPNRDEELAALIRAIFLPEIGELWLAADYSQQEYRLIVHFAERFALPKATDAADRYRNDPTTDFHDLVASLTGLERKPAKDSNFAKSYGAGIPKFAAMINKTVEEAEAIMKQYDTEMPFVSKLNGLCQKKAEKTGFIRLMDGARIHFDTWEPSWISKEEKSRGYASGRQYMMNDCSREEAEKRCAEPDHPWYGKRLKRAHCRKAMNGLIQGNAARQTKMAMRACWREKYVPLLQMHDELDFSLNSEKDGERIREIMRDVVKLRVPMQVDIEYGPTWGNAAKVKDKKSKTVTYDASWKAARALQKQMAKVKG
jgi:DNA polymerase I-like protein with 3'-5' exonuclease and polymerase domains